VAFFLWRRKRGIRERRQSLSPRGEGRTKSLTSQPSIFSPQSFDDRDMKGQHEPHDVMPLEQGRMMETKMHELSTGLIHVAEIDGREVSPVGSRANPRGAWEGIPVEDKTNLSFKGRPMRR